MIRILSIAGLLAWALITLDAEPDTVQGMPRHFQVQGVVEGVKPLERSVVIRHQAISNYMEAMTMPFSVKQSQDLEGIQRGDQVSFRLLVTEQESWIDQIVKTGIATPLPISPAPSPSPPAAFNLSQVPDFSLTNELGQPIHLGQFKGKAVALAFFFTRCPIPEYCPRITKNFEGACLKLKGMTNAPTNWQLLSLSFDPLDKPEVLKSYALQHHYDSNHWSFLTGHPEQIQELTRGFGVGVTNDGVFYNHNFATAVFDANGGLQSLWRFGGDTTSILVDEILKAAAGPQTNGIEKKKNH